VFCGCSKATEDKEENSQLVLDPIVEVDLEKGICWSNDERALGRIEACAPVSG
jgi:hypothetical protein